jgi:AcrR family transcriptional regulator
LFARHGFHGVTIEQLGAAVGISGPGIYRHFASKSAILAAMLTGISERLRTDGAAVVRAAASPRDALDRLTALHVDFAINEPDLIIVHDRDLGNLTRSDEHRVRRLQRAYVEMWASVLRRVNPRLAVDESRARAHALFGLLNSTPHSVAGLDRSAMARMLTEMTLRAAGVEPRP